MITVANSNQLLPAIRVRAHDQLFIGLPGDSHSDLERRHHIYTWDDAQRLFTPDDGVTLLNRQEAAAWVKTQDSSLWDIIAPQVDWSIGLHSHHLSPATDLSRLKALYIDRGLYTYNAQALGREFGHVYYYVLDSSPYRRTPFDDIGKGLPEIQRVDSFYRYLPKVDIVIIPDLYNYDDQKWLREQGYRVFGSADQIELDKIHFLDLLEAAGLPTPETYKVNGIDELLTFLSHRKPGDWWIKSLNRGDFDTKKFEGMRQLINWIDNYFRAHVGKSASTLPMLVQRTIPSVCEPGWDGLCLDGQYTSNGMVGYEDKDRGLVCKIFPTTPPILDRVNQGFADANRELGSRGHFSTEVRITDSGKPYFIDPTCRIPSPPGGLFPVMYSNYPQAVYQIACGLLPTLTPVAKYGVEVILTSPFNEEKEICVEYDEDVAAHIQMKNHYRRDGAQYVVPNKNSGFWGSVVVCGDDWEQLLKDADEIIDCIVCEELEHHTPEVEKMRGCIAAGEEWGIAWG